MYLLYIAVTVTSTTSSILLIAVTHLTVSCMPVPLSPAALASDASSSPAIKKPRCASKIHKRYTVSSSSSEGEGEESLTTAVTTAIKRKQYDD